MVSSAYGTDDREARPKFWIAVYTRPRSEKKAAKELERLGIETYLPIQKQLRLWSDRKKHVDVAVIPMVLFVYVSDDDIITIRQHSLIINVLSLPGSRTPAHIPEHQIKTLKYMLGQTDIQVSFESSKYRTSEKVIVIRGKLRGLIGEIKSIKDDFTTISVYIDLLGGALVNIKTIDVERYNSNKMSVR